MTKIVNTSDLLNYFFTKQGLLVLQLDKKKSDYLGVF